MNADEKRALDRQIVIALAAAVAIAVLGCAVLFGLLAMVPR